MGSHTSLRLRNAVKVLENGVGVTVCLGKADGAGIAGSDGVWHSHEHAGNVATKFLEIFGTAGSAEQTDPSAAGIAPYTE